MFIVNNQYAISLPVSKQCGAEVLASKGEGYGVPAVRVDGNDVVAVYQASKEAYIRARNGEGPTLIELLTYRAGPHSSSDDPTRYRGKEGEQWMTEDRDPILRAKKYMQKLGIWSEDYEARVWEEIRTRISLATADAEKRPEPTWESMFEDVYAEIPPALAAQRDELIEKESGFERQDEGEFPL
jgi:TPP-dependent pyruvate/acetoin dehydrogenase alpha subunit